MCVMRRLCYGAASFAGSLEAGSVTKVDSAGTGHVRRSLRLVFSCEGAEVSLGFGHRARWLSSPSDPVRARFLERGWRIGMSLVAGAGLLGALYCWGDNSLGHVGRGGPPPPRRPSGSPAKCSEVSRGKHPRRCALLRHQPLGWGGRPPPPALARLDVARPRCLRRAALDPLPTAVAPVLQQPSGAPGELQLASERRGSPTPSPPRLDPTSRSMAPKAPWSPFSTGDLPWRKLVGLLRVRHKGTEEVPLGKR